MDLPHECFHALPAMIAGDVVLGVQPDALDPVLIGTVGGQEVKPGVAHGSQGRPHHVALVNHVVVVEDHVDHLSRADERQLELPTGKSS